MKEIAGYVVSDDTAEVIEKTCLRSVLAMKEALKRELPIECILVRGSEVVINAVIGELGNALTKRLFDFVAVMDICEAANYLGISTDTMYKYANDKFIPAFKLGNRWRFRRVALEEWMKMEESKIEKETKTNTAER